MGYHDRFREQQAYRSKMMRNSHRHDLGVDRPRPGSAAWFRIGKVLSLCRYPGWTITLDEGMRLIAFRSDPAEPTRLEQLGPWPIPEDAGDDEVAAVVRAAVIGVDGEGARERFSILPGRKRP